MVQFRLSSLAIVMMLVALVSAPITQASDWHAFRGPQQDGTSTESKWSAKFPADGPKILWKKNVGTGAASVVVSGEHAITMGNRNGRDFVVSLNPETGEENWSFDYECAFDKRMFDGGTASTPTIDGDHVYTLSYDGHIHCLTLKDGKRVWAKHARQDFGGKLSRWKYAGSPLVLGNAVIFDIGGKTNSTLALNKKTGAKLWGSDSGNAGYATPVSFKAGRSTGVVVAKGTYVIGHDAKTGRKLFSFPWKTSYDVNAATPIILGDKILVSNGYGPGGTAMFSLSGQPKRLWFNSDLKPKTSSPVTYKGAIYGVSQIGGKLLCINAASGKTMWEERGFGGGTLTLAGDKIIALSDRGELVIAQATTSGFKPISRAKILSGTCWVNPVLANGRLYCKNNRGELVCIDVR